MTNPNHPSGTDRIAEAFCVRRYDVDDIIVGVQGDEPLIPVANIHQVADNLMQYPKAAVTTLCVPVQRAESVFNPHAVKVVRDQQGYALYFSRAPIPWVRGEFPDSPQHLTHHLIHVGLYCYRGSFLAQYASMPPSPLETLESLEQLRVLSAGLKIHVDIAYEPTPPGVDTPACVERIVKWNPGLMYANQP